MARRTNTRVSRIGMTQARNSLSKIIQRVRANKECIILEKDGIPVAGIIDLDELEDYLELQDPKVASQVREGRIAYLKGQGRELHEFLDEIKLKPSFGKKKA